MVIKDFILTLRSLIYEKNNYFKVLDDDTSAFWGTENYGRFVNDRTSNNESENYGEEINALCDALKAYLDKVYFGK